MIWKNMYMLTESLCYTPEINTAAAKSLQSCPTLCDPIDGSPPGSPVPGILQARTLEWVATSFSNVWKWKVKVKLLSCVRPLAPHGLQPTRLLHPWDFPGKSTGVKLTLYCFNKSILCVSVRVYSVVSDSLQHYELETTRLLSPWNFPGKSTGVGCHFLLQGIFWPRDQIHASCVSCYT